jgi:Cof subfamily protein (haloacid dehalogenase superfamily)
MPAPEGPTAPILRAVATDLDGTIVHDDQPPSARTVAALARLRAHDVELVIVTARPPRAIAYLLESLDHHGSVICANGALVVDLASGRVVRDHSLAPDVALEVVRRLRADLPGITFAVETHQAYSREPTYVSSWPDTAATVLAAAEDLVAAPVAKLLGRHPELSHDEVIEVAERVVGDLAVHHASGAPGLLELSAPGVSKAIALEELTGGLGIDAAEVVAFGDMPNDTPMLTWAGIGVAVANAHPDVLAIADETTASCADDGVARWIEARWASGA